jgi:hypothetical protein
VALPEVIYLVVRRFPYQLKRVLTRASVLLSTFLALLIPAVTTYPALSRKSFVAVWIISVLPTTFLGGRWRYAALPFMGLTGG